MHRLVVAMLLGTVLIAASAHGSAGASIFEDVGTFTYTRIEPTARLRAMGGASGAVFWGDVDGSSNPAVLGLARGVRYESETTEPGFGFEDEARRTVLGWGGLGITLAGRPFSGMGGIRSRGSFVLQSSAGAPLYVEIDDEVEYWSVGANVSGLVARVAEMSGGRAPPFTRLADLAFGLTRKDVRGTFDSFVDPAIDLGLLVRTGTALPARAGDGRVDLAYGYSMENAGGEGARPHRHGAAVRFTLDPPAFSKQRAALALEPLLSLGGAWDRVFITSERAPAGDESHLGAEVGVADVAFLRFGEGPGGVSTWGFGFALPIGHLARVRYDRATRDAFDVVTTHGWSLWLDPLAIAAAWRHRQGVR